MKAAVLCFFMSVVCWIEFVRLMLPHIRDGEDDDPFSVCFFAQMAVTLMLRT